MFIGHFALGLAAKRVAPKTNLGIYFIACQFLDLLWPVLVLLGIESVRVDYAATEFTPLDFYYPYSHGLAMVGVWAVLFGVAALVLWKSKKLGLLLGALVFSHWVLDFVSHRPDLPLLFEGTKVGLGLWNSKLATLLVEGALFAGGVSLYLSATQRPTAKSKWAFWSLIVFLVVAYIANAFGPKPPVDMPAAAIAAPALAMWLFVLWAYVADRKST